MLLGRFAFQACPFNRVRQFEVEGRAAPLFAGRPDPATMGIDNPFADGKPESNAGARLAVSLPEPIENAR